MQLPFYLHAKKQNGKATVTLTLLINFFIHSLSINRRHSSNKLFAFYFLIKFSVRYISGSAN